MSYLEQAELLRLKVNEAYSAVAADPEFLEPLQTAKDFERLRLITSLTERWSSGGPESWSLAPKLACRTRAVSRLIRSIARGCLLSGLHGGATLYTRIVLNTGNADVRTIGRCRITVGRCPVR